MSAGLHQRLYFQGLDILLNCLANPFHQVVDVGSHVSNHLAGSDSMLACGEYEQLDRVDRADCGLYKRSASNFQLDLKNGWLQEPNISWITAQYCLWSCMTLSTWGLAGAQSLGRNVILSVSASKNSFKRAATSLLHPTLWQGHNCYSSSVIPLLCSAHFELPNHRDAVKFSIRVPQWRRALPKPRR